MPQLLNTAASMKPGLATGPKGHYGIVLFTTIFVPKNSRDATAAGGCPQL